MTPKKQQTQQQRPVETLQTKPLAKPVRLFKEPSPFNQKVNVDGPRKLDWM